jgi:hypothetical protein
MVFERPQHLKMSLRTVLSTAHFRNTQYKTPAIVSEGGRLAVIAEITISS